MKGEAGSSCHNLIELLCTKQVIDQEKLHESQGRTMPTIMGLRVGILTQVREFGSPARI
jgi:hypothetical protein